MVVNLRRLPLLWPVMLWVAGLTLARSDLLSITAALMQLTIALIVLLVIRRYGLLLILLRATLWGAADLLLDARDVAADQSWLSGNTKITASVEKVERASISSRLLVSTRWCSSLSKPGSGRSDGLPALIASLEVVMRLRCCGRQGDMTRRTVTTHHWC